MSLNPDKACLISVTLPLSDYSDTQAYPLSDYGDTRAYPLSGFSDAQAETFGKYMKGVSGFSDTPGLDLVTLAWSGFSDTRLVWI